LCLISPAGSNGRRNTGLQFTRGSFRTRSPRENVASLNSDFLLNVSQKTHGSKHLLLGTEEIPPGAVIPKHRHHAEDEILLIQTGNAHVWLGDKEYDAEPGALVFIPAGTWISLKNSGNENISLVFVWNDPGFEEMMRCASVPKGQVAEPISREGVKSCYHHGDAELEIVQSSADKRNEKNQRRRRLRTDDGPSGTYSGPAVRLEEMTSAEVPLSPQFLAPNNV
jgi:mannose-6-phosphate isomerase-like protein (cupin superfamily)